MEKDRSHNGQKKKDKQQSPKHYTTIDREPLIPLRTSDKVPYE